MAPFFFSNAQEELEQTAAKLKRVQGGGNDTDVLLLEEIKAFKVLF
jgi:hypothetical protein